MGADLGFIHHVGHVVRDMRPALDLYRRLGFDFAPPAYPMLSPRAGESPRPFGAANTHMSFPRSFVELATVVSDNIPPPSDARLIPLQVSPAALPRTLETIKGTVDGLAADLARFEGLHILVLGSPDATASAGILDKDGIRHGGPNLVQRPLDTTAGPVMASVKYVEIDREATPEGRLAIAENPPPAIQHAQAHMDHPNGAIDLSESILCTPDAEFDSYIERYRRLLGRAPRAAGEARIFDLDDARITLLPDAALPRVLPGELPPAVPAFVGYAVRSQRCHCCRRMASPQPSCRPKQFWSRQRPRSGRLSFFAKADLHEEYRDDIAGRPQVLTDRIFCPRFSQRMQLLHILAYIIALAEFAASSFFTLTGSRAHLTRLQEVRFPLPAARILAAIEALAVVGLVAGIWLPALRPISGITLALCFSPILARAIQVRRPIWDVLALAFFMLCAVVAATA